MRKESRRISGDRERWLTEKLSWFFFMRGELICEEKLSPFGKRGIKGDLQRRIISKRTTSSFGKSFGRTNSQSRLKTQNTAAEF
jgi:hypothetical protein